MMAPKGSYRIYVNWLGIEILVLPTHKICNKYIKKNKVTNLDDTEKDNAFATIVLYEGLSYFVLGVFARTQRVIYHEALHMAHHICEYKGIPINAANSEVQAYLQGHIAAQIKICLREDGKMAPAPKEE